MSITGDLAIHELQLGGVQLFVTANDFKIVDNKLGNVRVNSNLEIAGELRSPRIEGDFGVSTGQVDLDRILTLTTDSAYATEQTEYVTKPDVAAEPSSSSPADALKMDVRVTVPDDLVIKASDLRAPGAPVSLGAINLTLGGDLRATKEAGRQIMLVGAVNTVRGTYDFQGRRFQVLRDGSITFRGDTPPDPALNVTAERVISGIVAHVTIGGTVREPSVTLSSQPPLDQTDILSLIVFNQPANRLGQGQATDLGERAAQLAGGFVVTPLADTLGRALNVDIFEVDPSGDDGAGPTVTVGQQVGERLFLKFRQIFGARDVSEFQLEYQLTNILRLQGSFAEGQTSANRSLTRRVERGGIDLMVYFSY